MQDLTDYKGYSIFSYCTPTKAERFYEVNVLIQDIENKLPPEKIFKLDRNFTDIDVALITASEKGKELVDRSISSKCKISDLDTDIKYVEMKQNIE